MKRTIPLLLTVLLSATGGPAAGSADTAKFDGAMGPVLSEYQRIHQALSADSTKGVAESAKRIAKLAATLKPGAVTGKHAGHYKHLPQKIKAAAVELGKAKSIAKQREAFKELSRPLVMWATLSKPAGIDVLFCSMAKGSWLQRDKAIRNPYYGSKMLRCGEVILGPHKGKAAGHMPGHSR